MTELDVKRSPAEQWALAFVDSLPASVRRGDKLEEAFGDAWSVLTVTEQAAIAYDWPEWWARPAQLEPSGAWRSWGLCTGRGFGKTRALAEFVHREAMSGRAPRIALLAQDESEVTEIMIEGDSGLLSVAPPWERPQMDRGRLLWPNGAQAFIKTPQQPATIRGPGFHLAWCTELVAWPPTKRDEAWSNLRRTMRLGYARTVWDSTPKRRHPIIRDLLGRSEKQPERHVVVHGSSRENVANINTDELAEWEEELEGTARGREELHGEFIDDDESSLVKMVWIEGNRAEMPEQIDRKVLAVDPALSVRRGTDATGIVLVGRQQGHFYPYKDLSARYPFEVWGKLVVDVCIEEQVDCVIVERNAGGDAVLSNIRAAALIRRQSGEEIMVQKVGLEAKTKHKPGVIYVKEVWTSRSKSSRAEPVAAFYEKGLVHHVEGADLGQLEDEWTTWAPDLGEKSPNSLDACAWAISELAGILTDELPRKPDTMFGFGLARQALREKPQAGLGRVGSFLPRLGPRASRL